MQIVFSHGQDGAPWGTKIVAMAEVARRRGLEVVSVDYRGIDDPQQRVEKLLQEAGALQGPLVFVGSSLGGHVATAASTRLHTAGLFLLAPAFFMPGYEQHTPTPPSCPVAIVHGWNDDVVPVANSIRYAEQHRIELHVLDSDHRLTGSIEEICTLLDAFLQRLRR